MLYSHHLSFKMCIIIVQGEKTDIGRLNLLPISGIFCRILLQIGLKIFWTDVFTLMFREQTIYCSCVFVINILIMEGLFFFLTLMFREHKIYCSFVFIINNYRMEGLLMEEFLFTNYQMRGDYLRLLSLTNTYIFSS